MNEALTTLESVLIRETELHAALLRESEAKRDAIIQGDLDAMEATLDRERELVVLVEAAEVDRVQAVEAVREWMGLAEPVKLSDIIAAAPATQAGSLRRVHAALKDVIEKLRYRSRQNAELMKASMEHVEGFLRAIAEACAPRGGYGRDGRVHGKSASLINRSA